MCRQYPKAKLKLVYNPATAQYRDSLFTLTVSPILGLTGGITNGPSDESTISWKNGAKVYGSYGRLAFFAALQDNHQDPLLGEPEFLTTERGGHIKNGTDFSEMTGGASYMWKWGDVSFLKDAPVWGSGYAGTNILSGRAPSLHAAEASPQAGEMGGDDMALRMADIDGGRLGTVILDLQRIRPRIPRGLPHKVHLHQPLHLQACSPAVPLDRQQHHMV